MFKKTYEWGKYTRHKKWSSDVSLYAQIDSIYIGAKLSLSLRYFSIDIDLLFVGVHMEVWKRADS